jgi:hypothetical protein
MSLNHFEKLLAYLEANFYPCISLMENRNDLRLVLNGGKHLALRRHKIPLNSKEYTKKPATPNDLGMFKFMITFVSCFILQKVMPASGGCSQNVGLDRSLVLGMFPHPRALPYKKKPINFFVV